jgi:hypothetical protein
LPPCWDIQQEDMQILRKLARVFLKCRDRHVLRGAKQAAAVLFNALIQIRAVAARIGPGF